MSQLHLCDRHWRASIHKQRSVHVTERFQTAGLGHSVSFGPTTSPGEVPRTDRSLSKPSFTMFTLCFTTRYIARDMELYI
jgi:hypothetical protein